MTDIASTVDRGYALSAQGLLITRDLTRDEWWVLGRHLVSVANRTTWAIGDWLVYGAGRGDYGTFYDEAAVITGRSFDSLSQVSRVSRAFPMEKRTVLLPWSYYREVMPLDERERQAALVLAFRNEWTRDGLASYIRSRGVEPETATVSAERSAGARAAVAKRWNNWAMQSHHRVVSCPACGHKFEPKRKIRTVTKIA